MAKQHARPRRPGHPSIERARKIAQLMDSAVTIPVIRKKIGLDPLIGAIPVGGEVVSTLISAYLIYVAYELRLPTPVLARMGVNVAIDLLIGAVPVVGDIGDIFWKSNSMNFKLLEEAYQQHGVGPQYDENGQVTLDVTAEPI